MSLETVLVKEEPEWESSASECGVSEAAARAGLYAGHAVKDELVLGPECLQPPDVVYALRGPERAEVLPIFHAFTGFDTVSCFNGRGKKSAFDAWNAYPLVTTRFRVLVDGNMDEANSIIQKKICMTAVAVPVKSETDRDESSASMCNPKEENVGEELIRYTGVSAGGSYKCDVCGERFNLKVDLIKHVAVHIHVQDDHRFDCAEAPVLAWSLALAAQPTLRECSVRLARLPTHLLPSVCPSRPPMCLPPTTAQLARVSHTGLHDPGAGDTTHTLQPSDTSRYVCDTCGRTFQNKRYLAKHVQIHLLYRTTDSPKKSKMIKKIIPIENKTFSCVTCAKRFPRIGALRTHTRIHTEVKPYACELCKKRFARSDHLKNHNRMHSGEKRYTCEICGKRFQLLEYLRKHKLHHSVDKPYSCEICLKQFKLSHHLSRHKISHADEKPYTCDVCKKQFARSEHFKRHKQIHTAEKPFPCDTCHKTFREFHHMIRHKTVHTGDTDKSHKCEICGKWFSNMGNLKQHKVIHADEKPYKWETYGKRFVRVVTLKAHARSHTGEK